MSRYAAAARGLDGKISSMKNRGAYNGGPCPYGYTISPGTGKLVINPDEAEVVRKIFERWGTIKNGRYKKSELRQDDLFDKVKYTGWLVNNDSHHFHYDSVTHLFSES